jgi:subtilase family serine protease
MSKAEQAAQYLVNASGGGEISHSWFNMSYTDSKIDAFDNIFHNTSIPVINVAASGDYGWPTYPAGSPYVIAVGGTKINRDATDGSYLNEKAWNDTYSRMYLDPEWGTFGSGADLNRSIPTYQKSYWARY